MFYIVSGKEQEVRDLQKRFVTALKEKGYDDYVDTYVGELGLDGYCYMGVIFGKSPSDLWSQNEVMWELLGEEGAGCSMNCENILNEEHSNNSGI